MLIDIEGLILKLIESLRACGKRSQVELRTRRSLLTGCFHILRTSDLSGILLMFVVSDGVGELQPQNIISVKSISL